MKADDSTTRLLKTGAATLLTVVVGLLVASPISEWHDRRLAERLTARIAETDDAAVKVPLRQLSELGDAAIRPLVVLSASQRETVAQLARQIVDRQLATLQVASSNATSDAWSISTLTLASALAEHIHAFGPGGKQWAEGVTLALVDLAEQLPGRAARAVLDDCSDVLAAIPPRGRRLRTVAPNGAIANVASPLEAVAPEPALDPLTRASEGSLEALARIQPRQETTTPPSLTKVPLQELHSTIIAEKSPSTNLGWTRRETPDRIVASEQPATTVVPHVPAADAPVSPSKQVVDVPTPQEMQRLAAQLSRLSTDALLLRLPKADFYESGVIRDVLRKRGIDSPELGLRQQLSSPDANERLRLVEEVTQLPAAAARRVLRWLLDDESADVRLAALTALGTSNAPELADVAREIAERDADPRVAELAARLLKQARRR